MRFYLSGGLGNQLFQYSYLAYLAHAKSESWLPLFAKGHNPHAESILTPELMIYGNFRFGAWNPVVDPIGFRLAHRAFVSGGEQLGYSEDNANFLEKFRMGYFQTHRYVSWLDANFTRAPIERMAGSCVNEDVLVHVRRGDYRPRYRDFGLLSPDYYSRALREAGATKSAPIAFSSDEPDFAAAMLRRLGYRNLYEVSGPPRDVILQSNMFRTQIISNSSFAWWFSGLISIQGRRVFAPGDWFRGVPSPNEVLRPSWTIVDSSFSGSADG